MIGTCKQHVNSYMLNLQKKLKKHASNINHTINVLKHVGNMLKYVQKKTCKQCVKLCNTQLHIYKKMLMHTNKIQQHACNMITLPINYQ